MSRCEGRIEVYHNGTWGTVCDDLWDINAAHVVCRLLDCGEGIGALGNGHFGEGVGSILLDNVQCQGNETTLGHCRHLGLFMHNCGHSEDAGVICSGTHSLFLLRLLEPLLVGDLEMHIRKLGSSSSPPNTCSGLFSGLVPGGLLVFLSLS